MRKTKIVCTIGPACSSEEVLKEMCLAGMNVARLNFSHGTHEQHRENIERIKKVREELGLPIAILLDTKGPEYRIRTFENGKETLAVGETFRFYGEERIGDHSGVSVSYPSLAEELSPGDRILVDNGILVFRVEGFEGRDVVTTVEFGGEIKDRKSMSFPGKVLNQVYLSEQDKADIAFGIEQGIDFIACSFVSRKQDLVDVQEYVKEKGGDGIELIAKIENRHGVDNIDEICEACSGIMVARGDLGVEIPFEELPKIQKMLISKCSLLGKRVITATEMLESMTHSPRPTRAETSDVANAVYDGTSAVMLSGETAAGEYPVLAVKAMSRIAEHTEENIDYAQLFRDREFKIGNIIDAISHATCGMAIDINASAIAVCSLSGMTARMVSRFRPPMDILGMCCDEGTMRKLALSWGVQPAICEQLESTEVLFYTAKNRSKKVFGLNKGDRIVITGGIAGQSGNTNLIKVETINN